MYVILPPWPSSVISYSVLLCFANNNNNIGRTSATIARRVKWLFPLRLLEIEDGWWDLNYKCYLMNDIKYSYCISFIRSRNCFNIRIICWTWWFHKYSSFQCRINRGEEYWWYASEDWRLMTFQKMNCLLKFHEIVYTPDFWWIIKWKVVLNLLKATRLSLFQTACSVVINYRKRINFLL